MKKNDDFASENENLLLNKKRERSLESLNKFVVNSNNLAVKKQINCKQKQKKVIFDKTKVNEYAKLIENFFVNKYGMRTIKEYCFICHTNNYLSNNLLYFENEINLLIIKFINTKKFKLIHKNDSLYHTFTITS